MDKFLYKNHINVVDSTYAPILIVGRNTEDNDEDLILIHENTYFYHLNRYSITVDRLFSNIDFQQYAKKLLNSKDNSEINTLIYIGSGNSEVKFHGCSKRTSHAGELAADKSDIAIIQVNIQESLNDSFDNNSSEKIKIITDFNSEELASINEMLDKISIAMVHQEYINKDFDKLNETLEKHTLYQLTKNIDVSKIVSFGGVFLSLFTMLISILNTGNPILVENTKETIEHIKEIIR